MYGISGKMGAGKSRLCRIIGECTGAREYAFADGVRAVFEALTCVPASETRTAEQKRRVLPEWNMTVGQMLQKLGTDAVRDHVHTNAWVIRGFAAWARDGQP